MTEPSTTYTPQLSKSASPIVELYEAINSIAGKAELPEEWSQKIEKCAFSAFTQSGLALDNNRPLQFQADLLAGSLKFSYRRWHAAAALHFCLKEKAGNGPKWRNWMSTGMPALLDPDEQKQAMFFLECIAQDCEGRIQAYLHGKVDVSLDKLRKIPPLFSKADARWVECLGFERMELIELLDEVGIAHDLMNRTESIEANGPMPAHPTVSASTPAAVSNEGNWSVPAPATVVATNTSHAAVFAMMVDSLSGEQPDPHQQTSGPVAAKPPSRNENKFKRDTLDDQIDKAIELANGSYRTASVWQHLKNLALDGTAPFKGLLSESGALKYEKDEYKIGEDPVGTLTKNALDLRLQRRWLNLGYVGPRR